MRTINTSIIDFRELIEGGFVCVDKTAQLGEQAKPNAHDDPCRVKTHFVSSQSGFTIMYLSLELEKGS